MKKILSALAAALLLGTALIGCSDPSDDNSNGGNGNSAELLAKKQALYEKLVGTKWVYDVSYGGTASPGVIIFADDSVAFDNVDHSVNVSSNVYLPEEVDAHTKELGSYIYFLFDHTFYGFETYSESTRGLLRFYKDNSEVIYIYDRDSTYSGEEGGSQDAASVAGTYSYTGASGSEVNGSLTLADGSWSYSGSKTNMAAKSGTYTVSGSKITFKWTVSGYDVTDTFTFTEQSDGKVKWTCENSSNSVFLNMIFGIVGKTEVVLGKD